MASTTTKILTNKFHFPTGLRRGGGGADPFVVKDYENGPFFLSLSLITFKSSSICLAQILNQSNSIRLGNPRLRDLEAFLLIVMYRDLEASGLMYRDLEALIKKV